MQNSHVKGSLEDGKRAAIYCLVETCSKILIILTCIYEFSFLKSIQDPGLFEKNDFSMYLYIALDFISVLLFQMSLIVECLMMLFWLKTYRIFVKDLIKKYFSFLLDLIRKNSIDLKQ